MFLRLGRTALLAARALSSHTLVRYNSTAPKEFKVLLDNQTLYINQELAEALGWKPDGGIEGANLTLSGWPPHYFTITPKGSDSDLLSRATVESSRNANVKGVLDYLKDR